MKKLVLIAMCLVLSVGAFSQETNFGVKAGLNLSNFSGDDADVDTKAGIYLGGFVTFKMCDKFAIQPELLYSEQGAKDGDLKWRTNYLNLPIMGKYYVTENFNVHAGPQIGFLLKSELEEGNVELDVKDDTKGVDFGLGFGVEYELEMGLSLNARYNLGLTKLDDTDDPMDLKHSVFQIGAAFKF